MYNIHIYGLVTSTPTYIRYIYNMNVTYHSMIYLYLYILIYITYIYTILIYIYITKLDIFPS